MAESPNAAVEQGLLAIVACNGRCKKAQRLLEARGVLNIRANTLYRWKQEHSARYEELREEHAQDLEKRLTSGLRDSSMLASEGMQEAIQRAIERLEEDKDPDPAKTAANLATVADKAARNMLALSGRPTSITENRNVTEILRSLAANHPDIIHIAEEPAELEAGEPGDGSG